MHLIKFHLILNKLNLNTTLVILKKKFKPSGVFILIFL